MEFDRAVEAVCDWVETNSSWNETLLVVTADHETGYLTGPASGTIGGLPVWNALTFRGIGVQPGMQWNARDHTNSLVPIFVKGASVRSLLRYADSTDPVRGRYLDNTELPVFVVRAMR
jgi:alkaline phosphatase